MQQRDLGSSGIMVSQLALGTATFGAETDEATARLQIDQYLDRGGNFIDTADQYNNGAAEEIVGRALAGRRDRVVLATKGRLPIGDDRRGAGRASLLRACEASLRRLQTDVIDLYQIHWPDYDVPIAETLGVLDELVTAGKVRAIGCSNFGGWQLAEALGISAANAWPSFVSLQSRYSLLSRELDMELLPNCRKHNIAVLPWSPLGGGVLTGKYAAGSPPPPDSRKAGAFGFLTQDLDDRNQAIAAEVARVASETGHTMAQIALNWVTHRPGVTAPVLGARTVSQLEDNLGSLGWRLSEEHTKALDRVSRTPLFYPFDMHRALGFMKMT
ncbi:MAG: aldo/keto reductase [Acidimicrobiia bacterium]